MDDCCNRLQYVYLNYAYHYTLIKFSESSVLEEVYSKISLPLIRIQSIHFSLTEAVENSKTEHRKMYEFLKENRVEEFISLLRKHTEDVITNVSKILF